MSTRASTTIEELPTDDQELNGSEVATEDAYAPPEVDPLEGVDENTSPYDEMGVARWQDDDGNPIDQFGNVIPERFEVTDEPNVEPEPEPAAPPRKETYRSPFAEGIFSQSEQEEYDERVDARTQELIDKRVMGLLGREFVARTQQQRLARSLGIAPEFQDDVMEKMAVVESHVPVENKGTKFGAEIALFLAATREAGEDGSAVDVIRRWSTPAPAPKTPTPQPRQPIPAMAPSQRSVAARPAPDASRGKAPQKMLGTLTQDQIKLIQAERKTVKNGR